MESHPLDAESCYRAVVARDTRFDGHFFTAVKTTGVYCRPICSARTPRRTSCDFYRTAAAAEHAGFRPCLRCRPELAPGRVDFNTTLAESIFAHLQAGALDEGSIETLAADIGLSSRQLRRIVLDHYGVTPIEVAQTHRLLFAKKLLQETDLSMTQLAFASGFRSLRRFNAAFRDRYGLSPSALRREAHEDAHAETHEDAHELRQGDIVLRLSYRPPLDWDAMARYLGGRGARGVERVDHVDGVVVYRRTVALPSAGGPVQGWLSVSLPTAAQAQRRSYANVLVVTLSSGLLPALMNAAQRLRELFDLDADPLRIVAHLASDPLLAADIAAAPGLRMPGAWDRFELALRAVLGQQVSVAGASTLSGRMAERFGESIATPFAGLDRAAVTADVLAHADLDDIAAIGMPKSRANTIRELARFAVGGGLRMAPGTSCDDAVARLDAVPGIGPWTAHYVAMRALRYPDAFPAGDLGLRKALGVLQGSTAAPTEAVLERRSDAWRPWRAYAAIHLWHALARRAAFVQERKS
jgi:AraC family transcriptional regulator of adaptative response / DNA-3-methyladenine glycosylase II